MPASASIYLDHNATTPLHPKVRESMISLLGDLPGNPSSLHHLGRKARRIIEQARERVAAYLQVLPSELFFTAGGSESNNLFVGGLDHSEHRLFYSQIEHPSILEPAKRYARSRSQELLTVDSLGQLQAPEFLLKEGVLREQWITLQWVNNETGVIQNLEHWTRYFHSAGARLHSDGAQGFFRMPISLAQIPLDAATLTAHKSFGPAGVGVLFLRQGMILDPPFLGGPQERGLRPGTENLLAIHGLGVLAKLCCEQPLWDESRLWDQNRLFRQALAQIPRLLFNTSEENSFPAVLNISLEDLDSQVVLMQLDQSGICASTGSACASGLGKASTVLKAYGFSDRRQRGTLRFSWGPNTSDLELLRTAEVLQSSVTRLRKSRESSS